MKMKFSTILLSLLLVVSMMPFLSMGVNAVEIGCTGEHNGWKAIHQESDFDNLTNGDKLYLAEDVEVEDTIEIPEHVQLQLCLNGHVLKYIGSDNEPVIRVFDEGNLLIDSCQNTEHRFSVKSNGRWILDEYLGDKVVKSGCIIGGKNSAIETSGGSSSTALTINNANIVGNCAYDEKGSAINILVGEFSMNGGSVMGNASLSDGKKHGAISVCNTLPTRLDGVNISYNSSNKSNPNSMGGGMYIGDFSTVFLSNCTITHNEAYKGGGLYVTNEEPFCSALQLTNCTISDNEAVIGGGIYSLGTHELKVINDGKETVITNNHAQKVAGGFAIVTPSVEDLDVYLYDGFKVSGNTAEIVGDNLIIDPTKKQFLIFPDFNSADIRYTTMKTDNLDSISSESDVEYTAGILTHSYFTNCPTATIETHFHYEGGNGIRVNKDNGEIKLHKSDDYYAVHIDQSIEHGKVTLNNYTQEAGTGVKLDISADSGYKLSSLTVKTKSNKTVEVNSSNIFRMPEETVTVSAKFISEDTPEPGKEKVAVELLRATTSGKKVVKLAWNSIQDASKYVVYGAKCGKSYKALKTIKGTKFTVKKIKGKKLEAHKTYKFYVVAYTPNGKVKSRTIHFITGNTAGKYANVKSIKSKYDNLLLSIGETKKLGATYKMFSGKKHVKKSHGSTLVYTSNCPSVAKVSSSGVVTAVSKGTATIYIQDVGGKYCKTKVTVN